MTEEAKVEEIKIIKSVIIPEICTWIDDEGTGYDIEVTLPGVEKDKIKLKMLDDGFFVEGETDTVRYSGTYDVCCPIDSVNAKASYKNGLLKIHMPFMDILKDAVEVNIE